MKTMFYGGSIITMDENNPYAEAVLVEDGKIKAVGRCEDVYENADKSTVMYNLKGRTMIPGFIEGGGYGEMKAGNDADFTITDNNPLESGTDKISQTDISQTVVMQ